jgi:hypothetical protein
MSTGIGQGFERSATIQASWVSRQSFAGVSMFLDRMVAGLFLEVGDAGDVRELVQHEEAWDLSVAITGDIYGHVLAGRQKKAAASLEQKLLGGHNEGAHLVPNVLKRVIKT